MVDGRKSWSCKQAATSPLLAPQSVGPFQAAHRHPAVKGLRCFWPFSELQSSICKELVMRMALIIVTVHAVAGRPMSGRSG
eukprot:4400913-Amphidinium_carterae.2